MNADAPPGSAAPSPLSGDQARHGFSFIELLLVITIIVMLAAMLMAGLGMLRRQSRLVRTKSIMQQVEAAVIEYLRTDPILGNTHDATSSDFTNSPLAFLVRNRIAAGLDPLFDASLKTCAGPSNGPWTAASFPQGDQILDGFMRADNSNILQWSIMNGQTQGSSSYTYTKALYLRSTAGTPDNPADDLILRYQSSDGSWTWMTWSDAENDTPPPW